MNAGPEMISILQDLYAGASSTIQGASQTEPVPIQAGVKQGGPISPILFTLAIEPLLQTIQTSHTGYTLYNHEIPTLAFADDMALTACIVPEMKNMLTSITSLLS